MSSISKRARHQIQRSENECGIIVGNFDFGQVASKLQSARRIKNSDNSQLHNWPLHVTLNKTYCSLLKKTTCKWNQWSPKLLGLNLQPMAAFRRHCKASATPRGPSWNSNTAGNFDFPPANTCLHLTTCDDVVRSKCKHYPLIFYCWLSLSGPHLKSLWSSRLCLLSCPRRWHAG